MATGFNFRTIKKYLIEADIYKGKERNKRTGVTILVDEQSYSFESITSAAGFLTRRDEEIKRKLLSKSETFEDGYNYPVLKVSSYRRYINYAISGELDKLLKRDFDWEVKING